MLLLLVKLEHNEVLTIVHKHEKNLIVFFFLKKRQNEDYNKQREIFFKILLFISMTIIISFLKKKKKPWLVDLGFSSFTFPPPWPVDLLWTGYCGSTTVRKCIVLFING